MILLDTNVVSEWMRPAPDPGVIAWLDRPRPAELFLFAVTTAEIQTGIALMPHGARRDRLRLAAESVIAAFEGRCLPFDCSVAAAYAEVLPRSRRLGRPMSVEDAQIAAIASTHGLQLATRNVADFAHLEHRRVVDPWQA